MTTTTPMRPETPILVHGLSDGDEWTATTAGQLLLDNVDDPDEIADALIRLARGWSEVRIGGGAAPVVTLRRDDDVERCAALAEGFRRRRGAWHDDDARNRAVDWLQREIERLQGEIGYERWRRAATTVDDAQGCPA